MATDSDIRHFAKTFGTIWEAGRAAWPIAPPQHWRPVRVRHVHAAGGVPALGLVEINVATNLPPERYHYTVLTTTDSAHGRRAFIAEPEATLDHLPMAFYRLTFDARYDAGWAAFKPSGGHEPPH